MKKKTLLDVECNEIFQEFSVLTDISTTTYQAEIPTAFQGMLFLVIDQVMVAKYPEPPTDQKETLLRVFEYISHDMFLTPETCRLLWLGTTQMRTPGSTTSPQRIVSTIYRYANIV